MEVRLTVVASLLISQVVSLQWSSCGKDTDPVQLVNLTVTPDILHFPGYISVNAFGKLRENITEPIKVELEMFKKILWSEYVRIPCEDNIGSCTYDDICALSPYTEDCPQLFQKFKLPCKCPIKKGIYSIKGLRVYVGSIHLPKFLVNGKYKIHASITSGDEEIGCYDIKLGIK